MYNNDTLKFVINGKYSRTIFLTRGVKQGRIIEYLVNKLGLSWAKLSHIVCFEKCAILSVY